MLYDRVMRNIQNRHKRIKHMNSLINARLQRKSRKFAENPIWVTRLGSRVPAPTYEMGPGSRVSGPTNNPGSRVRPFGCAESYGFSIRKLTWLQKKFKDIAFKYKQMPGGKLSRLAGTKLNFHM